jgi:hypothetical protein
MLLIENAKERHPELLTTCTQGQRRRRKVPGPGAHRASVSKCHRRQCACSVPTACDLMCIMRSFFNPIPVSFFADPLGLLLQRQAAAPQRPVLRHIQEIRQSCWRHPGQGAPARPRARPVAAKPVSFTRRDRLAVLGPLFMSLISAPCMQPSLLRIQLPSKGRRSTCVATKPSIMAWLPLLLQRCACQCSIKPSTRVPLINHTLAGSWYRPRKN